jgi:drug/metabolite transporter (DMT)-like permease
MTAVHETADTHDTHDSASPTATVQLVVLTAVVMVAFASNSLLNRSALADEFIGPGEFAALRVLSGAVVLVVLVGATGRAVPRPASPDLAAIVALAAYLIGFSFAYVSIDAGLGALILFGGVQATMFAGALLGGERPPANRWLGMGIAAGGLVVLFWPSDDVELPARGAILMLTAAVGWGIYSLIGRRVTEPLRATTWNFVYAAPVVIVAWLVFADGDETTTRGVLLAVVSGAVTSGLGYALWYSILPRLGATNAALAQLSAPVIAIALGAALLDEDVTAQAVVAAALVLGGIAIGTRTRRRSGV